MANFRPFRALRPKPEFAKQIASRPYDVLDSEEARAEADGNPLSFLRVIKPEIELPADIDPYSEEVYRKGSQNLLRLKNDGILVNDPDPHFYIYRLTMDGREQTGIVGCCDYQEYYDGRIKKHELTRTAKENDRFLHVETQNANAEPVFFSPTGLNLQLICLLMKSLLRNQFTTLLRMIISGMNCGLWMIRPRFLCSMKRLKEFQIFMWQMDIIERQQRPE